MKRPNKRYVVRLELEEPARLERMVSVGRRAAAKLAAICCSKAPNGRRRLTSQLLADRLLELNIVDSVSYETVRRTPKKTS